MDFNLTLVLQIVVALGLLNIWILRFGKPTVYRGGNAASMIDEFHAYGLPTWAMYVVGAFKIVAAVALLVGIWQPAWILPAALGLVVLMAGAISMHIKIKDPIHKSMPALSMLLMNLYIVVDLSNVI